MDENNGEVLWGGARSVSVLSWHTLTLYLHVLTKGKLSEPHPFGFL